MRSLALLLVACTHAAPPVAASCGASHAIAGYFDGAQVKTGAYWLCELPDRVVLATRSEAVSIPRISPGQLTRAPVTASCTDPCGHDGWAGCSMQQTCTLQSPIATIATGMPTDSPFGVVRTVDGAACAAPDNVIASCDTPAHTITVRSDGTATLDGRAISGKTCGDTFMGGGATLAFGDAPSLTVGGARESCIAFARAP